MTAPSHAHVAGADDHLVEVPPMLALVDPEPHGWATSLVVAPEAGPDERWAPADGSVGSPGLSTVRPPIGAATPSTPPAAGLAGANVVHAQAVGTSERDIGIGIDADARPDPADHVGRPSVAEADAGGLTLPAVVPMPIPSFEAFYEAHRARIGRAIAFALGDLDLAADATDEAFTRAYERWSSVSQGNPPAWVYRVAMNWALSILRRRRRGNHRFYDPAESGPAVVEPAVHAALAELDPKHRSVVVCRHLLGWSVAETAAALHLREGTVKSRLSRATAILQARLHHLNPTEEQS